MVGCCDDFSQPRSQAVYTEHHKGHGQQAREGRFEAHKLFEVGFFNSRLAPGEQMIEKDIRVNNEFYVCPVFNEAIADKKEIRVFNVDKMWGLGTPEDLDYYLKNYKK